MDTFNKEPKTTKCEKEQTETLDPSTFAWFLLRNLGFRV